MGILCCRKVKPSIGFMKEMRDTAWEAFSAQVLLQLCRQSDENQSVIQVSALGQVERPGMNQNPQHSRSTASPARRPSEPFRAVTATRGITGVCVPHWKSSLHHPHNGPPPVPDHTEEIAISYPQPTCSGISRAAATPINFIYLINNGKRCPTKNQGLT